MKTKCKWLVDYKNTPPMRYDCERVYDKNNREDIGDMIHFNNLKKCKECKRG